MIIVVSGDVIKKYFTRFQANREKYAAKKEIHNLKRRVMELEIYNKRKIEKRLQAIETIVVDREYDLRVKFEEVLDEK